MDTTGNDDDDGTILTENTITFGKYRNQTIQTVLKDRKYCKWLLDQDWFKQNYPLLFNKVKEFNPLLFFIKDTTKDSKELSFLNTYTYFNLVHPTDIHLSLLEEEQNCYKYYYGLIDSFKQKIIDRQTDCETNIFDIKSPKNWLIDFEKETGILRATLKTFLYTYDLPNIASIIEDIKKEGNIVYLGAKSFKIAKERSKNQEIWWEQSLKLKYGDHISVQFKYNNCFFDFLNINTNTIYECKLGFKDFNEEQYNKYLLILKNYNIIYLISRDCIIHLKYKIIVTYNKSYESQINSSKLNINFYNILQNCKLSFVEPDQFLNYI